MLFPYMPFLHSPQDVPSTTGDYCDCSICNFLRTRHGQITLIPKYQLSKKQQLEDVKMSRLQRPGQQ